MRRVLAFVAVLFAFSAIMGATVAHAHRYVSTPIVVLNHVDAENKPILVVVEIQRGQIDLGEGIVMPCGQHHAIDVDAVAMLPAADCALPQALLITGRTTWPSHLSLRPPISA